MELSQRFPSESFSEFNVSFSQFFFRSVCNKNHFSVPPNITTELQFIDALEGTSRQIDCLVESFPTPMSYWVKEKESHRGTISQGVLEQR
jgi:hypothetical protein